MSDIYTVRMGLIDTKLWSQHAIVDFYKSELSKLGFRTSQLPTVEYPLTHVKLEANQPFQGARTIHISVPFLGDFEQTRDTRISFDKDPAALAESGKAVASIFIWNLCSPEDSKDPLGALRDLFRRVKPEGVIKLSPKVSKFADAPLTMDGYPAKQLGELLCTTPSTSKAQAKNTGLWSLLIGIGLSAISKGKL